MVYRGALISIGAALSIIILLIVWLLVQPNDTVVIVTPPILEGKNLQTVHDVLSAFYPSELIQIIADFGSADCSDLIEIVAVYENSIVTVDCP